MVKIYKNLDNNGIAKFKKLVFAILDKMHVAYFW